MGPLDILHMNGNVPISPPGLIPQTQPNHTRTTFRQPQPSDDYFSDPCYLLVILSLSVEPKPIWLLPANWTKSC